MIKERLRYINRLVKLDNSHVISIINESKLKAYKREGKLWFNVKCYASLLFVLSIFSFCAGLAITAISDIIGYPLLSSAILVVLIIGVFGTKINKLLLIWFLYPYNEANDGI